MGLLIMKGHPAVLEYHYIVESVLTAAITSQTLKCTLAEFW